MKMPCVFFYYGGLCRDGTRKRQESKIGNVAKGLHSFPISNALSWSGLWKRPSVMEALHMKRECSCSGAG